MNVKDCTTNVLLDIYKTKGFKKLLEASTKLLKQTEKGSELRTEKGSIKGEIAEVVLYCILLEFQSSVSFPTHIEKGLFVQDPTSGKVTELDLVLITPFKIFIFESKSYSGKKKELRDKCQLFRDGKLCADVYEQNKMHTLIFNMNYGMFTNQKEKPYTMILFDYASNLFKDNREPHYREAIPLVSQETVISTLMKQLAKYPKKKVDVKKIKNKIKINSSNGQYLTGEHKRQLGY